MRVAVRSRRVRARLTLQSSDYERSSLRRLDPGKLYHSIRESRRTNSCGQPGEWMEGKKLHIAAPFLPNSCNSWSCVGIVGSPLHSTEPVKLVPPPHCAHKTILVICSRRRCDRIASSSDSATSYKSVLSVRHSTHSALTNCPGMDLDRGVSQLKKAEFSQDRIDKNTLRVRTPTIRLLLYEHLQSFSSFQL